jgi:hypothetical protein
VRRSLALARGTRFVLLVEIRDSGRAVVMVEDDR